MVVTSPFSGGCYELLECQSSGGELARRFDSVVCFYMEDDAAGMVLRLALKTRFSEMGWGSTPLLSATQHGPALCS